MKRLAVWLTGEAAGIVIACLIWTAWSNRDAEERLCNWRKAER